MSVAVYALVFLALGIVLLAIEVTLIPGFGVVGTLGAASMLYGGWLAWDQYGPLAGVASLAGGTVIAVAMFYALLKSGWSRRMVLQGRQQGDPSPLPAEAPRLVGKRGKAESPLRPGGFARIDGRRTDVVAEDGAWIEVGQAVEVVRVAQNSVVVRATVDESQQEGSG